MKRFGGPVTPFGRRNASPGDNDEYALWDAAYVLGSLSSAERSEYQAHENLPVHAGRPWRSSAACRRCCHGWTVRMWPRSTRADLTAARQPCALRC